MIQRVQTAFLLAAFIFSLVMIFHPVSRMGLSDGSGAVFTSTGVKSVEEPQRNYLHTFPIAVLAVVSAILSAATILLYQNRMLQMRLCVYNILLTIGLAILIFVYYFIIKKGTIVNEVYVMTHAFSVSIVLPFINIILIFQAFRSIRRDDLLIKSYDRLR